MKLLFRILMVAATIFAALNLVNGQTTAANAQLHKFQNTATGEYSTVVKTKDSTINQIFIREAGYPSRNLTISSEKQEYVILNDKPTFKTIIMGIDKRTKKTFNIEAFNNTETIDAKDDGTTISKWDYFTIKDYPFTQSNVYLNLSLLPPKSIKQNVKKTVGRSRK